MRIPVDAIIPKEKLTHYLLVPRQKNDKSAFRNLETKEVKIMKPELYKEVALTEDIPTENLKKGDVAVLVDYVPHPAGGNV